MTQLIVTPKKFYTYWNHANCLEHSMKTKLPSLSKTDRKAVMSLSKLTPAQRQRVIDRETVKRASPPPRANES